mgnify:CR=1 FL=1
MYKYLFAFALMFASASYSHAEGGSKVAYVICVMPDGTKVYLRGDATDEEIIEVYDKWDRDHKVE